MKYIIITLLLLTSCGTLESKQSSRDDFKSSNDYAETFPAAGRLR